MHKTVTMPLKINSLEEYHHQYKKSVENPEQFWEDIAETFSWRKKWNTVVDWNFEEPKVEWFKRSQTKHH